MSLFGTIRDALSGETVRVTNGGLDVNIQDQHTRTFDTKFKQTITTPTTLTADGVIDAYSISATTGHGISVGDGVAIFDATVGRAYEGEALVAGANVIELDTPLNFSYLAASSFIAGLTNDLAVDGSATRETFTISNPLPTEIDITRIIFKIITTGFPELDMFGDIAGGITRGIVLRVVNGTTVNYFNVKTNGELVGLMYDISFYEAAKHGSNGLGGRLTYGGQSKHGVTIRLSQGDTLEMIIQDDLSSLLSFEIMATGHEVE